MSKETSAKDFASTMNGFEVIDFHVHVYPQTPLSEPLAPVRKQLTQWFRPLSKMQQKAVSFAHKIPPSLRTISDEVSIPLLVPHLLIESDIFDLEREMLRESVSRAVVVAHPPLISNDFVFYESKRIQGIIPAVFIDPDTMKSSSDLDAFYNRGVRLFKINPQQSGVPADAPYYKDFLSYLNNKKAVLLVHTGALSSHFFRLPNSGNIKEYQTWFRDYPDIRFIAAHMNLHEPKEAIQMAQKYNNLSLLTSWQPASVLKQAIETLGPEKILFASDWPLLGENIHTQKERLWSLYKKGVLNEDGLRAILSGNAKKILT